MTTLVETLRFTVPGRPQSKGSKTARPVRQTDGTTRWVVTERNPNIKSWEAQIRHAASYYAHGPLVRHAVAVELNFIFARPRSHYGTGRNALRLKPSAPQEMTTTPDVDKLARAVLDALTGILWADDSQVTALGVRKVYGEPERLEIAVR